jgi:hypothetical protein
MQRSMFLIGTTALLAFAALMLVGCGVGSGGPESEQARRPTPTGPKTARTDALTR